MEIQFKTPEELKAVLEKSLATSGYFLIINPPPALRTTVSLNFTVQGSPERLEIKAEVVYVGGGGVGLTFIEGQATVKKKISDFIQMLLGGSTQLPSEPVTRTTPQAPPTHPDPVLQPSESQPAEPSADETLPDMKEDGGEEEPTGKDQPSDSFTESVIKGKMVNSLKIESKISVSEKNKLADFGDVSFTKILINLFEGKSTGIIRLKAPDQEKIVYFKNGKPVFVESNPPLADESLGQVLITKGKLKKEDLDTAIKYVEDNGVRIGEALMTLKLASPTLIKDALTYQLKLKLYDIFKWKEADFEMQMMSSINQRFGTRPVNVISIIYKGLKEKLKELYPAELEKFISPIYDKYLLRKESLLFDMENLGLNPHERRFWDLMLNGRRRVREIFAGSTLNRPDTFRFLYALLELDMIHINDRMTLDMPNIERDIYNESRFMEKMDYFDLLALHWSANKEKVGEAYKKKVEEYSVKKNTPNISADAIANINKILNLFKHACDELSDDQKRREYRKQVLGDTESKIAAELAARQAQLMEFRNDLKEARNLIDVAVDLDPSNMEYKSLRSKYGGKRK